jgi:hypothetical protein
MLEISHMNVVVKVFNLILAVMYYVLMFMISVV